LAHRFAQRVQDRGSGGSVGDRSHEPALDRLVLVEDEGLLAREVLEERRDGDIGGVSDLGDGHLVEASLEEQRHRGLRK
jgi:hypothetical protein